MSMVSLCAKPNCVSEREKDWGVMAYHAAVVVGPHNNIALRSFSVLKLCYL